MPPQSVVVAAAVTVTVAVRCSRAWCVVPSLTSGETSRWCVVPSSLVLAGCWVLGAARARARAGVRVVLALEFGSSHAACCSSHFDSKTGFRVGSSQPKTTQSVILEKFSKKKSFFRHNLDLGWKFPTLPWEERTERSSKRGFSYLGLEMCIERKKRKNQSKIEEKQSKIEKKKKRVLWTRQYLNDVQN